MNSKKLLGQQIDQYQIKQHIASGGLADIYLATDASLRREVVIKVLLPTLSHDPSFVTRFHREAECLSRLKHPNIIQIYGKGELPNRQPYIVMQYIEGGSLRDALEWLSQRGTLISPPQALTITREIAQALLHVHNAGIVHRNIKPGAILLQPIKTPIFDEVPILSSFGIATIEGSKKVTQTGAIVGTPHYMSPEQINGSALDGQSDLYSLGVVLYNVLTGKYPFEGEDAISTLHRAINEEPVPIENIRPDLSPKTCDVVRAAMQKNPRERLRTASEMIEAINKAIQAEKDRTFIPLSLSVKKLTDITETPVSQPSVPQPEKTNLKRAKDRLGRYLIQRELARGGMSTIYVALDPQLDREVAIKALPLEFSHDRNFATRFSREARIIARLDHRAIMPIYDVGEDRGINYIVMRLLSGGNLEQRLSKEGRLSLTDTIRFLKPIAEALDYAHERGVFHRDIKPSNIGFNVDDSPVLMDFGIVHLAQESTRLTATGGLIGTPAYMAPEQAQGEEVIGAPADIYALGLVAFESLAGRPPFSGDSPIKVAMAHVMEPIPVITDINPSLPSAVDIIFSTVLAKNPADRYSTAIAFINELAKAASNIPIPYLPPIGVEESLSESIPAQPKIEIDEILRRLWRGVISKFTSFFRSEDSTGVNREQTGIPFEKDNEIPIELPPSSIPPTVIESSQPSLILQPHVQGILSPVAQHTIKELMSHQEPERIVNYAATYGSGRFILTGYGSFGGTSLAREICRLIEQKFLTGKMKQNRGMLTVRLFSKYVKSGDDPVFTAKIVTKVSQKPIELGTFSTNVSNNHERQSLISLLDTLSGFLDGAKDSTPMRRQIDQIYKGQSPNKNLALIIDKIIDPDSLFNFLNHSLIENRPVILIVIVERESYNRWPEHIKKQLQRQFKCQVWPIPSLWEADYHMVEKTVDLLFSGFQMGSSEATENLQAFKKHIAYIGRGQIGSTFYELRQMRYWQIDESTQQAFITLELLDTELVKHHAWIQDLLDTNWEIILGTSFPGQDRTDRAKSGVYSMMDWIVDSSTFTLQETLSEASRRPVWITPYERLRNEVVIRLLDVLVDNNYLKQVENEFDIIWGRDLTKDAVGKTAKTMYADQIEILQKLLNDLMEDYQSANNQLSNALSDVERKRLQRQIDKLDKEIADIQRKLDSLHGRT